MVKLHTSHSTFGAVLGKSLQARACTTRTYKNIKSQSSATSTCTLKQTFCRDSASDTPHTRAGKVVILASDPRLQKKRRRLGAFDVPWLQERLSLSRSGTDHGGACVTSQGPHFVPLQSQLVESVGYQRSNDPLQAKPAARLCELCHGVLGRAGRWVRAIHLDAS